MAVVDSGVETAHEDLKDNIVPGYDFINNDPDPNPRPGTNDNHGTSVAGVIAAVEGPTIDLGLSVGGVGLAPKCRILPVKIFNSGSSPSWTPDAMYKGLIFAADYADIINCSWGGNDFRSAAGTDGFNYAATSGRNGKGCAIFCASGNSGTGYAEHRWDNLGEGQWYFEFEQTKASPGSSEWFRFAYIRFPDGSVDRFDTGTFTPGWINVGSGSWYLDSTPDYAYGTGRYSVRSDPNLTCKIRSATITVGPASPKSFVCQVWNTVNHAPQYVRAISLSGHPNREQIYNAPNSTFAPALDWPGNLSSTIDVGASTDWDYRADYSQWGGDLDFVTPSSGGTVDGFFTTDRMGAAGYNPTGNYTSLGRTSMACPLASGAAALVLSKNANLTAPDIRNILRRSCDKIGPVAYTYVGPDPADTRNDYYGFGRINAGQAVANTPADTVVPSFNGIAAATPRSIIVTFSKPMGSGVYTPNNYVISGPGSGSLANTSPTSVERVSIYAYRLTWASPALSRDSITITIAGTVLDASANALATPVSRTASGYVPGDFNSDGQSDITFQHNGTGNPPANGLIAAWYMSGITMTGSSLFTPDRPSDPGWRIAATGDLDLNGQVDLLWQFAGGASDGTLSVWYLNGIILTSSSLLNPSHPGDSRWRVVATGDFNQDNRVDLLFQYSGGDADGQLSVWYMYDLNYLGGAYLNPLHPGDSRWRVVGTGDFNYDGKVDIVFQHSATLDLSLWFMNGINLISSSYLNPSNPGPGWAVVGTGYYNSDSKVDLLFQHNDGYLAAWFMDGINLTGSSYLSPDYPGPGWRVVGPK